MVKIGDKLPSATLKHMDASGIQDITTEELTTGKKVRWLTTQRTDRALDAHYLCQCSVQVVIFAVPGAFTPTCR